MGKGEGTRRAKGGGDSVVRGDGSKVANMEVFELKRSTLSDERESYS